ncbi:MAG: F0F1 ATP synthase subunit delta [uncultured bacterium]|nr:MAG: F0F1 ATP synthase subunit delta [uncultured bacterium]OGH90873.1 MAG: ATP synthase F1 subunit delta [Candidatus Magasanikbacteria bacterium RIFOXYD12_FULL_33_17]HAO52326.1 ATP synthase F1 subunit delta [Candidatus Magasanikbacteria bacterium]
MKKLLPIQYAKILYSLTKDIDKSDLDKAVSEFFQFLKKERILLKTDSILKAFVKYSKEQEGIRFLKIKSAKKLSDAQMKEIVTSFGKNVEVESFVDESLIGGVVVQEGNTVLDGSIKTQLKKLEHKLI